jgi:hypothetical protein
MKIVREHFERGEDPRKTLGISEEPAEAKARKLL